MKKLASVFALSLLLFSCNKAAKDQYHVTVNINDIEDGTKAYLQKPSPMGQPEAIDTAEIKQGSLEFAGNVTTPAVHLIYIDGLKGVIPFVLEEGDIDVTAYKDSLNYSLLEGTPSNDDFTSYMVGTRQLRKKMQDLQTQAMDAQRKGDTVTLNVLKETFTEVQKEGQDYEASFVDEHPNSFVSLMVLQQMLNSRSKTPEEINEIYSKMKPELKETEIGKQLGEVLEKATKLSIGAKAPEFSGPTPEGSTLALSDALGKVTILDFWAAWCKPCRAENPNMVALYKKYHDKGLNVLGVSLDRTADDWNKAIAEDELPWQHVSNLKFWQDPIAQLYNVRAIPQTYVLDENGVIIAKNLRGEELQQKIAEILGSAEESIQ
ncbi:redoxin domain-containing protein [Robertkochia solimangrovi]|uniref:redoxin domain-containing protein n=1 Tax=Robertkochia solimangrovi TaxID=2213046 RepID=UPI00117FAE41|nr:redoxin domain-containing protein [Robertkochia solimangrovi]TRZ45299.1 AhpC/TSA family protein [Robertkochia solimangrovi]